MSPSRPSALQRKKQRIMYSPATIQTPLDSANRQVRFFGPFGDKHRSAVGGKSHGVSLVLRLLGKLNPATVAWAIIAVYVVSLYRVMLSRHTAKVVNEVLKPIIAEPSIADGDSASTVASVTGVGRIKAAILHVMVRIIFAGRSVSRRMPVAIIDARGFFESKAAAALHVSCLQAVSPAHGRLAAIAATFPQLMVCSRFATHVADDNESSKSRALVIFKSFSCWLRLINSHETFLSERVLNGESRADVTSVRSARFIIAESCGVAT